MNELCNPTECEAQIYRVMGIFRMFNSALSITLLILLKRQRPSEFISRTNIALESMAKKAAILDLTANLFPVGLYEIAIVR